MRFPRNAKIFRGHLDAAPFACLLFVLVIMLLLTWRLAFTAGVSINLPAVGQDLPGVANPIVVIVVDVDGQLHYKHEVVPEEKLVADLKLAVQQSTQPLTLAIHADRNVKLEAALRIAAAVRKIGFQQVIFTSRSAGTTELVPPK
ncbi:MAG: biopolymer transporter ExbD [Verrucomicrobiales bacterium]|nr:biopolymer transporter ExbD [Verrucomicrobiales bacterium]